MCDPACACSHHIDASRQVSPAITRLLLTVVPSEWDAPPLCRLAAVHGNPPVFARLGGADTEEGAKLDALGLSSCQAEEGTHTKFLIEYRDSLGRRPGLFSSFSLPLRRDLACALIRRLHTPPLRVLTLSHLPPPSSCATKTGMCFFSPLAAMHESLSRSSRYSAMSFPTMASHTTEGLSAYPP